MSLNVPCPASMSRHPLTTIADRSTGRRHSPRQGPRAASSTTTEAPANSVLQHDEPSEGPPRSISPFLDGLRPHNRQPANSQHGVAMLNLGINRGTPKYPSTSPHHMQPKKKNVHLPLGRRPVGRRLSRFGSLSWVRFARVSSQGGPNTKSVASALGRIAPSPAGEASERTLTLPALARSSAGRADQDGGQGEDGHGGIMGGI